ncbi:hypothetical protein [Natronomonas amylolytica]|uniref:hypothetical protein n=1 Tax=Natronomonas amylolytica TaxID=3108498 RepID=UPI00300B560B
MTQKKANHGQEKNSSPTKSDLGVRVPSTVYAQLEALKQSGIVNMYTEVREGLRQFGLDEAHDWLGANPEMYAMGLEKGFTPSNPEAVEEVDPDALRASIPDERKEPTRNDAETVHEQRILDNLQSMRQFSEVADEYYSRGEWGETASLTDDGREFAELFDQGFGRQQRACYRNALLSTATFGTQYDVTYVEGYVMADPLGTPIAHAWVEVDDRVVEMTFPEGPKPDSNAAYLGVEFSLDEVKSKVFDDEVVEPLVPDELQFPK